VRDCIRQNVDAYNLERIKMRKRAGDMKFEGPDCKRKAAGSGAGRFFMSWFRVYRWVKRCFLNQPDQSNVEYASWYEEFSANRITFAASFATLAGALGLHVVLPLGVSEPPLAILGCSLLSLVVNSRWGTIAAICYCVMVFVVKIHFHVAPFGLAALLWNFIMRFLFLEVYVLLFDMVRRQAGSLPEK
jgi:hypothetical protein